MPPYQSGRVMRKRCCMRWKGQVCAGVIVFASLFELLIITVNSSSTQLPEAINAHKTPLRLIIVIYVTSWRLSASYLRHIWAGRNNRYMFGFVRHTRIIIQDMIILIISEWAFGMWLPTTEQDQFVYSKGNESVFLYLTILTLFRLYIH